MEPPGDPTQSQQETLHGVTWGPHKVPPETLYGAARGSHTASPGGPTWCHPETPIWRPHVEPPGGPTSRHRGPRVAAPGDPLWCHPEAPHEVTRLNGATRSPRVGSLEPHRVAPGPTRPPPSRPTDAPREAQGCTPPPPRSVYRRLHDDPRGSPAAPPGKSEPGDSGLETGGTESRPRSAGGAGSGVCGDAAGRPQRGRGADPPREPRSRIRRQRWRSVGDPKDCGDPKARGIGIPKENGDGAPKNCAFGDPTDHGVWVPKDGGNGVPKSRGSGHPEERGVGVPQTSGVWIPRERGAPKPCAVGDPKARGSGRCQFCQPRGDGGPEEHQDGIPQERGAGGLKEGGTGGPEAHGDGDPRSCDTGVAAPPGAVPPAQGLRYLELLCRTLERLARLQEDNRQLRGARGGGGPGSLRAPPRPPSDGGGGLGTGRAEPFRTRSCSDSHAAGG